MVSIDLLVTINYIFYEEMEREEMEREEMEREEMEGEAMKTKRSWKVETQFEYSTLQRK